MHDLLLAGIKGVVEVEEVAALLKRAKVNEKIFEIPSVTADGLALLGKCYMQGGHFAGLVA